MRWPYKDLDVRKKSITLCYYVYNITNTFPKTERFWLVSQLRRAAVSIPSNIAEWSSRKSNKHYIVFLRSSIGSLYEVETQLEIAHHLSYIDDEKKFTILKLCNDCSNLLGWLIKYLTKYTTTNS